MHVPCVKRQHWDKIPHIRDGALVWARVVQANTFISSSIDKGAIFSQPKRYNIKASIMYVLIFPESKVPILMAELFPPFFTQRLTGSINSAFQSLYYDFCLNCPTFCSAKFVSWQKVILCSFTFWGFWYLAALLSLWGQCFVAAVKV